jgi:hypothetical protein
MIETQTFELAGSPEELATISRALWLMGEGNYEEAKRVLIMRHDQLTAAPKLKRYDQREAIG